MSFLSNVQSKVAHSSKIGLGKGELAQLQELIASEKAVLSNSHRLSLDTSKAASALREWGWCAARLCSPFCCCVLMTRCSGDAQGDDLFDVLGKVAYLFEQLSSAERRYSEHLATYRCALIVYYVSDTPKRCAGSPSRRCGRGKRASSTYENGKIN